MATIYYRKDRKRWILQASVRGERKQIGSFKTKAKAEEARNWLNSNVENYKADFLEVDEPRIWKFLRKVFRRDKKAL